MATISLCMIVKNEERVLGRCLASVRAIVDEIIVVDTGSTDGTIAVAEAFGARVFRAPWENDFAKARNISLQHATKEWVLVLDADEEIDPLDHARLRELTQNPNACYLLNQRHYTNDLRLNNSVACRGEHPTMEREYQGYFQSSLVRLWPNHRGIGYEGVVHELVNASITPSSGLSLKQTDLLIHHYGFTPESLAIRHHDKAKLYTELGLEKIKQNPNNWQAYYEIGIEHNLAGRAPEAIAAFKEALKLDPNQLWVWSNLAHVLSASGQTEEAQAAFNAALRIDPACKEVLSNYGLFFYRHKYYSDAEKVLRRAIAVDPSFITAWCNLAMVVSRSGRPSHAALLYERAIQINPHCVTARAALASLYNDIGHFKKAFECVDPVRSLPDPHHALALLALGIALKGLSNTEESLSVFSQLLDDPRTTTEVRALAHDHMMSLAH
jgi:glycosyltransferase involved in cell wall biosynthesis